MNNVCPIVVFVFDKETENNIASLLNDAELKDFLIVQNDRELMNILQNKIVSLVLIDINIPDIPGIDLLKSLKYKFPQVPIVIITSVDEVETAVECMKIGAFDYLTKPLERDRFISAVKRTMEMNTLRKEVNALRYSLLTGKIRDKAAFSSIVTQSRKMFAIFQYVEAIAQSHEPILITGETGVGKELIARAIHDLSNLKGDFIAVNIAGLDDSVISDTLFGHKKGAYTGADYDRQGMIVKASDGTLFLDEIGDMSHNTQTKLLRLLQDGEYYPLGSDEHLKNSARVIVATNHDIEKLIFEGKFRVDLYYRLRTHHLHVPPLRERKGDIPLLFNHFLEKTCQSLKKKKPSIPTELFTLLSTYHFPGNVRELQAMVTDAVTRHKARMLSMESFMEAIKEQTLTIPVSDSSYEEDDEGCLLEMFGHFPTLKEMEQYLISKALKMSEGNQGIAASMLGITRQALNRRLRRQ
jgi:DNA-binding NtrC family response regulator